eukprot:m.86771 g.86771  ORF g.86771 m.86771 type:complete len:88 (+) comp11494_c1_seq1:124-387(+)
MPDSPTSCFKCRMLVIRRQVPHPDPEIPQLPLIIAVELRRIIVRDAFSSTCPCAQAFGCCHIFDVNGTNPHCIVVLVKVLHEGDGTR